MAKVKVIARYIDDERILIIQEGYDLGGIVEFKVPTDDFWIWMRDVGFEVTRDKFAILEARKM